MFFRKTYANLVLTLSAILSYICFYYYLRILTNSFRRSADLSVAPSDSLDMILQSEEIGKYEEIAHLTETYATLQAFNSFFILVRLLFELGFSTEIAFILEVIYESLFDILFFTMTFAIVNDNYPLSPSKFLDIDWFCSWWKFNVWRSVYWFRRYWIVFPASFTLDGFWEPEWWFCRGCRYRNQGSVFHILGGKKVSFCLLHSLLLRSFVSWFY